MTRQIARDLQSDHRLAGTALAGNECRSSFRNAAEGQRVETRHTRFKLLERAHSFDSTPPTRSMSARMSERYIVLYERRSSRTGGNEAVHECSTDGWPSACCPSIHRRISGRGARRRL